MKTHFHCERICTWPCFDREAKRNSEMAYPVVWWAKQELAKERKKENNHVHK